MYRQGHGFLVTVGTWGRHRWFGIYPELCSAFGDIVVETAAQRGSQVFAWCAMPDHAHLLVQDADVIDFVRLVKGRMTPIVRRHEQGKKLWQRSFHDHGLRREESLERVALHILENPVRSGWVDVATDYPGSGSTVWPNWRETYDADGGRG